MGPVSVYRAGAVGADSVHTFGAEARDFDLRHAAWLGWLPLEVVEFAGPGVALVGDMWLTAPFDRSECPRRVVAGDVVTALDAAGELIARRESGLTAFTHRSADLSSESLWASSVAVLVALLTRSWSTLLTRWSRSGRFSTLVRAVRLVTRRCSGAAVGLCGICRKSSFVFTGCSMRQSGSGSSLHLWLLVDSRWVSLVSG